jgi:hypothetical protein
MNLEKFKAMIKFNRPSKSRIIVTLLALVVVVLFASVFTDPIMSDDKRDFIIHSK